MNKYLKIISVLFVLISSAYLPSVNAASSTDMLINIAESNPALLERLNTITLNDPLLLKNVLALSQSDPAKLERLLNLVETDLEAFVKLVRIFNAEAAQKNEEIRTNGTIDDDGGIIQT